MTGGVARARGPAERQLEPRLKWLMLGRLAIALACIFAILFIDPAHSGPPYYTLIAACLLNLVYLILARAGVGLRPLAVAQVVIDVFLVGVLVYFTGIDRFFAFLYFAVVIAAAMILGSRTAIAAASLASIVLAVVSTLFFLAGNPDALAGRVNLRLDLPLLDPAIVGTHNTRLAFLLPFLFFFALSLHVVALLAGRLTEEASRVRILNDEILQNMAGGIVASDSFGGVQFVNAQAARILGLPEAEAAPGRQVEEIMPREVAEVFRLALQSQERVAREVMIHGVPFSVAVSFLADPRGGPPRGVVAILNDLSLRTQIEAVTRRAERFQALLQMSAGMAHEVRNPLASIRGAAQELKLSQLPREDDRRLLEVVIRESDRLNQIISDFLDYASDRPVEMSLFDLSEVLRETAMLLEARQEDHGPEIRQEIPRSMLCRGAPDKLKQVFLNLGLNAVDACPRNGRLARVVFRCVASRGFEADPREGVIVEVEDNGCGMPGADLGRAFDPFFTTKPSGTGMGLAIARKIVQGHGGDVVLESKEGEGTVARVWLPS